MHTLRIQLSPLGYTQALAHTLAHTLSHTLSLSLARTRAQTLTLPLPLSLALPLTRYTSPLVDHHRPTGRAAGRRAAGGGTQPADTIPKVHVAAAGLVTAVVQAPSTLTLALSLTLTLNLAAQP